MMAERGRAVSGPEYVAAVEALQTAARRLAEWWASGFDVLVTPTLGRPPVELGVCSPDADPAMAFGAMGELGQFTTPWNATGQPAISLPLHRTADGLPVGVQLIAGYGREDLLLRVAAQLESVRPWADRRPAVWAG
jgi:amidase